MTNPTRDRAPPHLRRFVVEQGYAAYDEIDQAVWRFIPLQTYSRLSSIAHPAYLHGLRQIGISTERIPRIAEMDCCLGEFGWGGGRGRRVHPAPGLPGISSARNHDDRREHSQL